MIKRILLGLGGTQYTSVAIERAVKLAKQFEAEITGVTVVDFKRLAKICLVPKGAFQNHFIKVIKGVRLILRLKFGKMTA